MAPALVAPTARIEYFECFSSDPYQCRWGWEQGLNRVQQVVTTITVFQMGSGLQLPLEKLSGRSALPKIQLSTFPAGSKAEIVNTIAVRHREILLRWAR